MENRKILVFRNDRFGEFLLTIPAFRALKLSYPDSRLTAVVDPSVEELARRISGIDETLQWEKRRHSLFEILSFSSRLRREKFDLCVVFNPDREFHLIAFLAGISTRVGYGRKWGFLLTHRIEDRKHLAQKHEVEYNIDLLSAIGLHPKNKTLELDIGGKAVEGALRKFGLAEEPVLIAVHPWTSDPLKLWPPERFKMLTKELMRQAKVIVIGGKDELVKSHLCGFDSLPGAVDLTGKTTLIELAALLKAASLLVSSDSGPVHLACCVKTPVVALFRSDIPGKIAKRWGPWCGHAVVIEKRSLNDITVEEVLSNAQGMLQSGEKAGK